VVACVDLQPPD